MSDFANCRICDTEEELTDLSGLYPFGSEGIRVCDACKMAVTEFIRTLSSACGRMKLATCRAAVMNKKSNGTRALTSQRGMPLVCQQPNPDKPMLTVENYCKWYDFYLVFPDRHVEAFHSSPERAKFFEEAERRCVEEHSESAYCDHAFNPRFMWILADLAGVVLDWTSFELVIGRWEEEYKQTYNFDE
jgi:hypothetical protein